VRAQYHLWPTGEGLDAWDVHRLIRLSRGLPVRDVAVSSIKDLDCEYWFAGSREPATVRKVVEHVRLIAEVDMSHPIILGADGRVMDGMHRVARALLDGHATIKAVQFETDPAPDYRNCRPEDLPYADSATDDPAH